MDVVLKDVDGYFLEPYVYSHFPSFQEPSFLRNTIGLYLILSVGGWLMYFIFAALSYIIIYDKEQEKDPKFLKNQKSIEIKLASASIPLMAILTLPIVLLEVEGYSKLYDRIEDHPGGLPFFLMSIATFLLFTDMGIYWIHRGLHYRWFYQYIHKPHHWWKVPTPFASHAFHPVDGFLQSVSYHIYVFLFPMQKTSYILLFLFVNFWTISIHDGYYKVPGLMRAFVNGAAHHTDHHLFFNYNYGQFFTLWDKIGGSYRAPDTFNSHNGKKSKEGSLPKDDKRKEKKVKKGG